MAELAFLKPLIMEPLLEIMEDELQDDMVRQKVDEVSRYLYSNGDMTINSYKFLMDLFTHPTLWWVVILYGLAALFFGRIREGTIVDDWVKFFETKAGGGTESRIQAEEPAVVKQLQIELLQEQVGQLEELQGLMEDVGEEGSYRVSYKNGDIQLEEAGFGF